MVGAGDGPVGRILGIAVKTQLSLFVDEENILVGVMMISPFQ